MEKSKDEAMRFKTLGNGYFKEHVHLRALQHYTKVQLVNYWQKKIFNFFFKFSEQAIQLAPFNEEDECHFLDQSLEIMRQKNPSKYKVAKLLYATTTTTYGGAEKDALLSQCFGNRSAVLYEMKKYNAS